MRISQAAVILSSLLGANAIPATTDIYYHEKTTRLGPAVWAFGSEGVTIHSVDGSEVLLTHTKETLGCNGDDGCYFFDVVSDGHKYVWASSIHASPHRLDVFSIETGAYVGGVAACNTPLDLNYVPAREEMWVRCAQPGESEDAGHMTVVPVNALSANPLQVAIGEGLGDRQYGYSVFHDTLGNSGYATANGLNVIYKVDMAQKTAHDNFTLPEGTHSAYDMTYSPMNKHLFIRSRVCCACGFEGADAASCGRAATAGAQMEILVGPFAGETTNGTCGLSCEGSAADVIGVVEYDTVGETVVANHNIKEGTGWGSTPEASPDGAHIVMFPNDGGQNVRVLKANANGEASSVAFDIPVDFQNVPPGREAINDFAFVMWEEHTIIAMSSNFDPNLVLVDVSADPPAVHKLELSATPEATSGSSIEWVYGTDYLWVGGNENGEAFIVKLSPDGDITKAVVEDVALVAASHLIYVEDYQYKKEMEMFQSMIASMGAVQAQENDGRRNLRL